jgi:hypothetical protein
MHSMQLDERPMRADLAPGATGQDYFLALPDLLLLAGAGGSADLDGWSPMIDFAGQTEKIGHLRQPTARATGQRVIGVAP